MSGHTPGPWEVGETTSNKLAICADGWVLAIQDGALYHPRGKANAARIVACVNALEGMNPDAVAQLVEAARDAITDMEKSDRRNSKAVRRFAATLANLAGEG